MEFRRYGVYYAPPRGPLANFGAQWLGWDLDAGQPVAQPDWPHLPLPIEEITQTPRKYGFHATLKPPFRLAEGQTEAALMDAFDLLGTRSFHPIDNLRLSVTPLGRFLALTATGNTAQIGAMADMCVETLDVFRAPPTDSELNKRRQKGLSLNQERLLLTWGYPHVMEEFRFHMTLTGRLPKPVLPEVKAVLEGALQEILAEPFVIDCICLVGQDHDGQFHLIRRHSLSG